MHRRQATHLSPSVPNFMRLLSIQARFALSPVLVTFESPVVGYCNSVLSESLVLVCEKPDLFSGFFLVHDASLPSASIFLQVLIGFRS